MRHSKYFSQNDGLRMVIILCALLAVVIMPACSKKAGEETPPAGKAAVSDKAVVSDKAQNAATAVSQQQRQEMTKQLQQLQGELILKQGVVLNRHPELLTEQGELRKLIEEKMQALLAPKNVDMKKLQEIQVKLQDKNLSVEQKKPLMAEFQEKSQLAKQARMDAMNDEKVKAKYQQYADHLKELMVSEYPETKQQIESFDKIQAELRKTS